MTTGEKIKVAREEFGWSQDRLAKEINISRHSLSRIETSEELNMKAATAVLIAKALGLSLDYLLCLDR